MDFPLTTSPQYLCSTSFLSTVAINSSIRTGWPYLAIDSTGFLKGSFSNISELSFFSLMIRISKARFPSLFRQQGMMNVNARFEALSPQKPFTIAKSIMVLA